MASTTAHFHQGIGALSITVLASLQPMVTNGYFLLGLLISAIIALGLLVLFMARRRRRR